MTNNNQNNFFNTVQETKSEFNTYFSKIGAKNFKQFYHDWHSVNMYAPFADLADYFAKNSNKSEFESFVKDFSIYVDNFNNDDVKNEKFSVKSYAKTADGSLRNIMDRVDSFSFQVRQFVFSFAKNEEHNAIFGNYPVKTNMPYAHHKGMQIAQNILKSMAKNYDYLAQNPKENTAFFVDSYMRAKVFKSYSFNDNYSYEDKMNFVQKVKDLNEKMSEQFSQEVQNNEPKSKFADMFQLEHNDKPVYNTGDKYLPNGFELEFYYPEELGSNAQFMEYLKEKNGWENIYTSNKDACVYDDEKSAGVLMRDESLANHNGLVPVEYASKIMRNKDDEKQCLKLLDSMDKGYVNKHCSLHQHVSAESFDLDTYKRLVKRVMQHEKDVVSNFAAEERRDNRLLYATYISNNLSQDAKKDYPMLCVMVDMCENKNELVDMVSYGRKYKTLNIVPKHTVEFRYMNAHFNREYAQGYLQFNRDMVQSAIENNGCHTNKALANKYNWHNNVMNDKRTVMKDISYMYQYPFDSYNPDISVNSQVKDGDQRQGMLVKQALNATGKMKVYNPMRVGR